MTFVNTISGKYNPVPEIFIACGPMSNAYCGNVSFLLFPFPIFFIFLFLSSLFILFVLTSFTRHAQVVATTVDATFISLWGYNTGIRGCGMLIVIVIIIIIVIYPPYY